MLECSVVICTLNPPLETLARVLDALKQQSLPLSQWELVIVDNGSTPALCDHLDLAWHPHARCLVESVPGLVAARLCGTQGTRSDLIIFVDDDNILRSDYLETAVRLSREWPAIGVWSGRSDPEFSEPPPDWSRPWWPHLAISEFETDEVCVQWNRVSALPQGAGMCVRRSVMEAYAASFTNNPLRGQLGRAGSQLMSGDDNDIALTAYELGQGTGRFTSLHLVHIIPPWRLTRTYILRLIEAMAASREILNHLHPRFSYAMPSPYPHFVRVLRHGLRFPGWERQQQMALLKGEQRGRKMLQARLSAS